jgi:hypothetical protein
MLVRCFVNQLISEFAFAGLIIFMQSAESHNAVSNNGLLLPHFKEKRFPETRLGSASKGRYCANLETMEDAALLRIPGERCRDRCGQEQLRPRNGRSAWQRQCRGVWLASLFSWKFVPVTGTTSGGTSITCGFCLVTFYSPYLGGGVES